MKRFALIALWSALWPTLAWSAPAVVTGGEHSDFTRLVVTLPERAEWRLGRVADGYTLSVDQEGLQYDLKRAFTRIPKTRLADVAQVPSTSDLHIVAACPCYVTAFAFRPNVIVVDIRAGEPPTDSAFEDPLVSFADQAVPVQEPVAPQPPERTEIALDWTQRLDTKPERETPVPAFTTQLPTGFRETIVKQLGAAASQGLVTLDTAKVEEEPEVSQVLPDAEPPAESHFRVLTEAGMDMRLGGSTEEPEPLQEKCLPEEAVDLAAWGTSGEDPALQLSAIHRMLVTDADRLPADKLSDAAKQYLYLGFGAEARLVLGGLVAPTEEHRALADMGRILDGAQISQSAFSGMETCNSAAALWAVLARDELRLSEPVASGAIVQAFSALPYHLREMLAARLIDRLLEQGDESAANMIRDTISRVVTETPAAMQMAEARLELHEDRPEKAKAALEAASAAPGPDEAAALVALVDIDFAARNPVNAERIAMLETLAAQNRGQEIGQDLQRALVLAYGLAGEFGLAKRALENAPAAAGSFWTLMAERGAESDILELAFSPPSDRAAINEDSALSLAQKLLTLGFPQQALLWLGVPRGDVPEMPNVARLTIAEAQLALFEPREALSTVSGMGEEANPVRAKAMRALGRPDEAAALMQGDPGLTEELSVMQRTERQWEALAAQQEGTWAGAAALALETEAPLPGETPVTLAAANAAASKASETRDLLGALLQETQLSAPSP